MDKKRLYLLLYMHKYTRTNIDIENSWQLESIPVPWRFLQSMPKERMGQRNQQVVMSLSRRISNVFLISETDKEIIFVLLYQR